MKAATAALVRDIENCASEIAMWGERMFDAYTFDSVSPDCIVRAMNGAFTSTHIIPRVPQRGEIYEERWGRYRPSSSCWNVKRLRPAEFGPWDFTLPPHAGWIGGLTNTRHSAASAGSERNIIPATRFRTVTGIESAPAVVDERGRVVASAPF